MTLNYTYNHKTNPNKHQEEVYWPVINVIETELVIEPENLVDREPVGIGPEPEKNQKKKKNRFTKNT